MILRSPAEHEKRAASLHANANVISAIAASVMPAWIAGIQARRMRPDTSRSTWVPAVHAGTTSSYNDYVTHTNLMAIVLHPTKFSKERMKYTKFRKIYFRTLRDLRS